MSACDRYVYAIEEKHGRMIYVGVGKGNRWAWHLKQARRGIVGKQNPAKGEYLIHCLAAGIELETYKIAEHLTIDEACKLEIEVIELLGRRDLGTGPLLNASAGGFGVKNLSANTKARIGMANARRVWTPEARANKAASQKGRKSSPIAIAKTVAAHLGKKRSFETLENMRKAWVERVARAEAAGVPVHKPLTAEQCARISAAKKGCRHTPESKAKLSAAKKGKALSADHKEKISRSLARNNRRKGILHTDETKKKIAASLAGNQNARRAMATDLFSSVESAHAI